jgi:glyoxylase-like metal-dependent hydrolase (beta-lactamase superfamily II)
MVSVDTISTRGLGDRSNLATDGEVAVVIDPQRDIDRVSRLLTDRGVRLTHVLETHIHNDYVSGGYELARATGATYVVAFSRLGAPEGAVIRSGRLLVGFLLTRGHTHAQLC